MVDAAVTWKAEFGTTLLHGESGAHTECNDFCVHQGVHRFRFSFWLVLSRTSANLYLVSGLTHDRSRAVLKDLVSHPETVHPAVYTVIVIGGVIFLLLS